MTGSNLAVPGKAAWSGHQSRRESRAVLGHQTVGTCGNQTQPDAGYKRSWLLRRSRLLSPPVSEGGSASGEPPQ
jgi:hypothetical protein